jgi:uncharacterized protein (DUF488 family)
MKTVFTLGTSTHTPEEFLRLLTHYEIGAVVDVRRFPTSRFEHFIKDNLARLLEESGFSYVYMGEGLGGYRSGGYEKHMASDDFKGALSALEELAKDKPTAILCAERLPWKCHRRYIARSLADRGWQVRHIIDETREWVPKE